MMRKGDCRTIFNLKADPDDLSPVTSHIVTTIKEALTADQKVILLAGEDHTIISQVHFAETLRGALYRAGIQKTAIAVETAHNFLEERLPAYYPDTQEADQESFRQQVPGILPRIKKEEALLYHRLQALSYAAWNWPVAPLTNHGNLKAWLENKVPVYLIDMAKFYGLFNSYLDGKNPETTVIIKTYAPEEKENIKTTCPTGMHLRNHFMAAKIKEIMAGSTAPSVLVVQTGRDHLGGNEKNNNPYEESLHSILTADFAGKNIKILTLLPETDAYSYETILSAPAQEAMNNAETIILREVNNNKHQQDRIGSFKTEARTLASQYECSGRVGKPPTLKDEAAYKQSLAAMKEQLTAELKSAIARYAPVQNGVNKRGRSFYNPFCG